MPTFTSKIRKMPKKSFMGILYFAAGMFSTTSQPSG
jgi:hypothetical protein